MHSWFARSAHVSQRTLAAASGTAPRPPPILATSTAVLRSAAAHLDRMQLCPCLCSNSVGGVSEEQERGTGTRQPQQGQGEQAKKEHRDNKVQGTGYRVHDMHTRTTQPAEQCGGLPKTDLCAGCVPAVSCCAVCARRQGWTCSQKCGLGQCSCVTAVSRRGRRNREDPVVWGRNGADLMARPSSGRELERPWVDDDVLTTQRHKRLVLGGRVVLFISRIQKKGTSHTATHAPTRSRTHCSRAHPLSQSIHKCGLSSNIVARITSDCGTIREEPGGRWSCTAEPPRQRQSVAAGDSRVSLGLRAAVRRRRWVGQAVRWDRLNRPVVAEYHLGQSTYGERTAKDGERTVGMGSGRTVKGVVPDRWGGRRRAGW